MATATITPNFTVLSTCDVNTGWTGCVTPDADFKKQGLNSLSGVLKSSGVNLAYYTKAAGSMANTHIRIWVNFLFGNYLASKANHGIAIYVFDGTNVGLWDMYGVEDYPGGWVLLEVDTRRAFNSGAPNLANITRVGIQITLTASPRNVTTTYVDYLVYGDSIKVTGGTSVDPITFNDIALADAAGGYGAFEKINGVYFSNTGIVIGDGTGSVNTYLEDSNQIVVYKNEPVNSALYKMQFVASPTNTTSILLNNCIIKSVSILSRFTLDADDTNLDILELVANTFINAAYSLFKSGQIIDGNNWVNSNQIKPNGALMTNGVISGSTDSLGALLWNNDDTISDIQFSNNDIAIQITVSDTQTFVGLIFAGNTADVNNTSGAELYINNTVGSDAASYIGSLVNFISSVLLVLTSLKNNSEVKVYKGLPGLTAILIGGTEAVVNETFSMSHSIPGQVGYIMIDHLDYIQMKIPMIFSSNDSSIPVAQQFDRVFNDPV